MWKVLAGRIKLFKSLKHIIYNNDKNKKKRFVTEKDNDTGYIYRNGRQVI